jgi:uncharacterized protein (DUF427 family)
MKESDLEEARARWKHRGSDRPEWAIEPGPGQESVWDYPRPPRIEPDSRLVRVEYQGTVIAETERAMRVLETASPPAFYIPPDDVRMELLERTGGASLCEWKGSARYWSLHLDDGTVVDKVAWSYEEPFPKYMALEGALSFYPAKVECYVDGERVEAQAGGFYGGWITPEIVGPFKGDPGTGDW